MLKIKLGQLLAAEPIIAKWLYETDDNNEIKLFAPDGSPATPDESGNMNGRPRERRLPAALAMQVGMLRRAIAPHLEEYRTVFAEAVARMREQVEAIVVDEDLPEEQRKLERVKQEGEIEKRVNREIHELHEAEIALDHLKRISARQLERAGIVIGSFEVDLVEWLLEA